MNEFKIISNYLQKLTKNNPSAIDLNDDVFFNKKKKLVISVDTYNQKIHFLDLKKPYLVIKKVLRASISDIVSKGAFPKYFFLSASLKKNSLNKRKLNEIIKSLKEEQKMYNIKLSGGDTTQSNTNSFTVMTVGFSNKIVKRNNCKLNDDIYVTGNIGDSYVGLCLLKKKLININNSLKKYFTKKYYLPDVPIKLCKYINKYANSSIDVSDGLFDDMSKLLNKQKLNYIIYLDKIPVSENFQSVIQNLGLNKLNYISKGDDYQTIFTAPKSARSHIINISKKVNQKITLIGCISNISSNKLVIGKKSINPIDFKGYSHKF
tara:strand:+ start:712 stop:1671 length:960 start_codon:yes stop_codon:yes gene_type:complete